MSPARHNLRELDAPSLTALHDQLRAALEEFETSDGVRIPGTVWIVSAVG
jgi:hypothetical protein